MASGVSSGRATARSGFRERFPKLAAHLPDVALVVAPAPIWARDVRFDRAAPLVEDLGEAGMSELMSAQLLATLAVWSVAARRIALACAPATYGLAGAAGGCVVFVRADLFLADFARRAGVAMPAHFPSESVVIDMRDALAAQATASGKIFYEADNAGVSGGVR